MTHPAVSLCAVIGVPDERLGEEVKAFVVRKAGATLGRDELIAWCREQMAAYKYPRTWSSATRCRWARRARCSSASSAAPAARPDSWVPDARGTAMNHPQSAFLGLLVVVGAGAVWLGPGSRPAAVTRLSSHDAVANRSSPA